MKKFRVEFNTTGYYSGEGIWDTVDEITEIEAENEKEAIEFAKEWWIESSDDAGKSEAEVEEYAWRASEIKHDEDGCIEDYKWVFED